VIGVSAKVEWLKGSDKALAEIGTKTTQKNVLIRTLKKAAKPIDDQASALAPRDTGKLQISVITGTQLTRRQRGSAYKAGKLGVAEVHVGTALSRGLFQEFGTYKMPASPFMRPAWDANKDKALSIIGTELWVEIRKAGERAARKRAKAGL
jgi:HK97 gp10 family phage protein